ncbi:MAG: class I SAM-dependent methyltransferase [Lutibacter sp.]|nr:class I SAM-dependent methyltransferase [Lutibacter sp.]
MKLQTLKESINGIDIYLLDQILKERYQAGEKIVDAGCGSGRNLKWFYQNDFEIYGTDVDEKRVDQCKTTYSTQKDHFRKAAIEEMPYKTNAFDHVICNAVLHFAKDDAHFKEMFSELIRILKPQGSLFIRMTSDFGMEDQIELLSEGVYKLPDGATRYLLNTKNLEALQNDFPIKLLETVKTTIVKDMRCMTTLVIQKEGLK